MGKKEKEKRKIQKKKLDPFLKILGHFFNIIDFLISVFLHCYA